MTQMDNHDTRSAAMCRLGCNLPIGSTAKPAPKRSFRYLFRSMWIQYGGLLFNAAMVMALTRQTRQTLHRRHP